MERTYTEEIELLKLGQGQVFHGEGILAVTKALLQSGVSYVGGYQGSPVTALLDVLVSAKDLLGELGVHVEACANEASAAAMLAASINYPVRGAVTWKVLGNGVGQDVVDHVSQIGVQDGAMIVVGEDYGGSSTSVLQRTLAWGVKSGIIVIDSRGDSQVLHRMVKEGMDISRDSQSVVAVLVRLRLGGPVFFLQPRVGLHAARFTSAILFTIVSAPGSGHASTHVPQPAH